MISTDENRCIGGSGRKWSMPKRAFHWLIITMLGMGTCLNGHAQLLDSDGDGHSDEVEIQIGTDPSSADSVFRILFPIEVDPALGITLSWKSVPGLEYRLQRWNADELGIINDPNWVDVVSAVADSELTTLSDNEPFSQDVRFYRVLAITAFFSESLSH